MLSNIIGLFTVLLVFRILRLENLKISTLLLVLAFFYDIYWVFISPSLFGESVMAVVAT